MVIVLRAAPPRLRGRLSLWFLEIRAGVYVGKVSRRVRDRVWNRVKYEIAADGGNAVMMWSTNNEAGYSFETFGDNRRHPVDFDGVQFVSFDPVEDENESMLAWLQEINDGTNWLEKEVDQVHVYSYEEE